MRPLLRCRARQAASKHRWRAIVLVDPATRRRYNARVGIVPIVQGSRIGAYEIAGPIGSGGMGEVYRARDHRLQRDVAIKVLPTRLCGDADRIARFEREARTLASISHPNIAIVHGFEDLAGSPALVMELVDGPTLADRIARGPLTTDESVAVAAQIADALEAAHDQGIIHRDLKPANIKLRPDGKVKILDFRSRKSTRRSR